MFKTIWVLGSVAMLSIPTAVEACVPPWITFGYASSQIPARGRQLLSLTARRALAGDSIVKVYAFIDGSERNRKISRHRVEAIKAVLVQSGVSEKRIRVEYGRARSGDRNIYVDVVSAHACGGV